MTSIVLCPPSTRNTGCGGFQVSTISNLNSSCIELELELGFDKKRICEKLDCEIRECHLRHPKICKFYRDLGFCKFSEWCKFSHNVEKETIDKDNIITKLEEKVKNLEMKIEEIVYLQDGK